jgi:starch phosphorylase
VIEVNPGIPERLARLEQLANNLWYSWDRPTRALFARLDTELWNSTGHSPKAFLRRVEERRLVEASLDDVFLGNFNRVLSAYDTYHAERTPQHGNRDLRANDLVAYFCAEFGFHESLPIYSGGLGILAGDHCKAASDLRLPFVAVGLLYRQGYFSQTIDADGAQKANYADSDFEELPVVPVLDPAGAELRVQVELPGRAVQARVWRAQVGHLALYLLDTDVEENSERDRDIGHRLYGGDRATRIEQEIVLGVGGVRALEKLGIQPTVWHINEGHAAFLILERMRALVAQGLDHAAALEAVAASTVFTTHTVVAAGHDHFAPEMVKQYLHTLREQCRMSDEQLLALGASPDSGEFNMTALAVRGSRFQNGVSRIHRQVSAELLGHLWPQLDPAESPIGYVTNAVHVPTFLAPEWIELYDRYLGFDWPRRLADPECLARMDRIPDQLVWAVHQSLKSQMLHLVRYRAGERHFRNQGSEAHLDRMLRLADPLNPNVLTVGFARRFATYKRAGLLFHDLDWLREIVNDAARPLLFIFAGKAHPADEPGQALIRHVNNMARRTDFEGKILLIEDYDLRLARRLVSGVDVWLNTPLYPYEASGTSGMKAGINGAVNLSVLDGWWGEGYDGRNGWAIKPASDLADPERRNLEESRTLYELLQDQVVPLYYAKTDAGFPVEWVRTVKRSMASVLQRYNAGRMLREYVDTCYAPAARQSARYAENDFAAPRTVAAWKAKVARAWGNVRLRRLDAPKRKMRFGERLRVEVAVALNGLAPEDVALELRLRGDAREKAQSFRFAHAGPLSESEQRYVLELNPERCGHLEYRVCAYPYHELLTHPLELGLIAWL